MLMLVPTDDTDWPIHSRRKSLDTRSGVVSTSRRMNPTAYVADCGLCGDKREVAIGEQPALPSLWDDDRRMDEVDNRRTAHSLYAGAVIGAHLEATDGREAVVVEGHVLGLQAAQHGR